MIDWGSWATRSVFPGATLTPALGVLLKEGSRFTRAFLSLLTGSAALEAAVVLGHRGVRDDSGAASSRRQIPARVAPRIFAVRELGKPL